MSDTTTLSHEYAASASFAEKVNSAVLRLKKAHYGKPVSNDWALEGARAELAPLVAAVATSLGATGVENGELGGLSDTSFAPPEVLDRLTERHANQLPYFLDDLKGTVAALHRGSVLGEKQLSTLDEICNAADATASASFRRLRRR